MELEWSYVVWSAIFLVPALIMVIYRKSSRSRSYNLPPGPPGWPIFGNMFDYEMSHEKLADLKHKYGPVVWLQFGSVKVLSILSAKAVAEFFKNHDLAFADRKFLDTLSVHDYTNGSLATSRYGTYWRVLRRICTVEMFVNKKINETVDIRRKCVDDMIQWIEDEANTVKKGSGVEVTRFLFLSTFNMLGNLMLSRDLVHPESKTASDFSKSMIDIMESSSHLNISDIFPCLTRFDLQGLRKEAHRVMAIALKIASGFVKERLKEREEGVEKKNDFLDVLLDFEGNGKDEPAKITEHQITIFILEMFLAGSDTSSNSVEWAMTELLRHPETMSRVKAEINEVVGENKKLEESDIEKLPYMQAVVKETLRLHPPLPFLLPRRARHDIKYMGYDIPEDTLVLPNVWAVGRDPECWKDPLDFKPERFLDSNIDFKGQYYELIPFGAGRRSCAGLQLGSRMLHFALGSLLREFDWELPSGVTPKSIDVTEKEGTVVRKLHPLEAIPRRRTSS